MIVLSSRSYCRHGLSMMQRLEALIQSLAQADLCSQRCQIPATHAADAVKASAVWRTFAPAPSTIIMYTVPVPHLLSRISWAPEVP